MKSLLIVTTLCASLAAASAQEKVAAEKAQSIGHKLRESLGDISDAQVKVESNADKSDAFSVDGAGALVVPDKNLTVAILEKAGGDITPLGQLFMKEISPAKNGKATPTDQLRSLTLADKGEEHRVTVLLLGVRKRDDQLELVAYGKDKEPLLQLPLRKVENTTQDLPVELSGEKQDDDTGMVTLSILGKYKATFLVKRVDG